MNEHEYYKWVADARESLSFKYPNPADVEKILAWFGMLRGSREIELVGADNVDRLCDLFFTQPFPFDLYTSMMMRVWFYAPYILMDCEYNLSTSHKD